MVQFVYIILIVTVSEAYPVIVKRVFKSGLERGAVSAVSFMMYGYDLWIFFGQSVSDLSRTVRASVINYDYFITRCYVRQHLN
ncbi:hypothetical protein BMS3Abin09_00331 [bacterium BMS3Abin09]|nr:hypothetical protein BMS3Abin09_00331 [bacterium BMS3Abin09]